MPTHPYRDPMAPAEPKPLESARVAHDDVVVAVLLLAVGVLAVVCGLSMDRQAQLTIGLVLIAFALKVAWDARASGAS